MDELIYLVQTREPRLAWQNRNKTPLSASQAAYLFIALAPSLDECTEIRIVSTTHDDA